MANQFKPSNQLSGPLREYNDQKSKTGKERFFSLENNNLNCYQKKKEMIESKEPKYSLNIQECKDIKLQKSKHGDILCIEHEDKTVFLIATRKEDINQWYDVLNRLCGNEDVKPRRRLGTEPTVNKRDPGQNVPRLSAPSSIDNFMYNENEAQRRPLAAIPEDQAQDHQDGRNRVVNIGQHKHTIKGLQEPSEPDFKGQGDIGQLSQSNNEEPIYMNNPKLPNNRPIKPRIAVEDEFPRPVPGDNKTPPPIPRKVTTTQPPPPVIRKEKTSDNPDTNRRARNSDEYVSELVRQQGNGSVTVNILKQVLTENKIKLAEINNGIWFGGFEHNCPENSQSHWLLFGDQLVQINDQWLNSAEFAGNIIETAGKPEVSMCVKRLPHAQIITIHREYEHQVLGLECRRREITKVSPDEIASTQVRLRPEATGISGMNCTWTITHINSDPIPPNITTEMMEEKLQMAGKTVHLIVQPTDFVQEITNACCNAHSC